MRVFVLLALAVGVVGAAYAAVRTFAWTPPTEYEDGSALAAAEITGYSINCGNTAGGPYDVLNLRAPGGATSMHLSDVPPGAWYCTARTIVGTGADEVMSERSNEVSFLVPRPLPRAPADLSAE